MMSSESVPRREVQQLAASLLPSIEHAIEDIASLDAKSPNLQVLSVLIDTFGPIGSQNTAILPQSVRHLAWALDRLFTQVLLEETGEVSKALAIAARTCASLCQALKALAEGEALADVGPSLSPALQFLGETPAETSPAPSVNAPVPADEPGSEAEGRIAVDDLELAAEFVFECTAHLDSIEDQILELEQRPEDLDLVNAVFRPFHSMKGGAGFLNLKAIQALAHETETLLDRCRKQQLAVDAPVIDLTLQSVDTLKQLVGNVARSTELLQGKPVDKGAFRKVEYEPLVQRIRNFLELAAAESKRPQPIGQILLQQGAVSEVDLDKALALQGAPIGEILIATGAVTASAVDEALQKQRKPEEGGVSAIKVDTEKLDALVNLVGELVIAQSLVAQNEALKQLSPLMASNQSFYRNLTQLGKITKDMQDQVMLLRMMPLKHTFQKMNRLVRDLSKAQNKQIDFITTGEETELDKNVIEQMSDPLVHLLRNALDHGIESPEERIKAG